MAEKVRENLGVLAEVAEANELIILMEKEHRFNKMLSSPPTNDQNLLTAFYKALTDNIAEVTLLRDQWWGMMKQKYSLPDGSQIDFQTRDFFVEK